MKILPTAFEPFDGETINPALEAVKRVADHVGDAEVIKPPAGACQHPL